MTVTPAERGEYWIQDRNYKMMYIDINILLCLVCRGRKDEPTRAAVVGVNGDECRDEDVCLGKVNRRREGRERKEGRWRMGYDRE